MPALMKASSEKESQKERTRILNSISEHWHGDLAAYLEVVAKLREEAQRHTADKANQVSIESMLKVYRQC